MKVFFFTTSFGTNFNGPSNFAIILYEAYRNNPEVEFNIVTERNYSSYSENIIDLKNMYGCMHPYLKFYLWYKEKVKCADKATIFHLNSSHYFPVDNKVAAKNIGSINDSIAVQRIKRKSFKRNLEIFRRHKVEKINSIRSDLTIFNSNYLMEKASKEYKVAAGKILYKSPNIMIQENNKKKGTKLKLLTIGSDVERKNYKMLVNAVAELTHTELKIAGCTQNEYENYFSIRHKHKNIIFLGKINRDEVAEEIKKTDCIILASLEEALGVSILEGIFANRPVIGSNLGGIPEIITSDLIGCLIDPYSKESIKKKIIDVSKKIDNEFFSSNEAITERLRLQEKFSQKLMVQNLLGLYREVL